MEKINLIQKLSTFTETWDPRIIAELNGQAVKLVKLQGEFIWHHHEQEDELFLVVKGRLVMQFRDQDITLEEGEMVVIPAGVEHCPLAQEEAQVLLFEPSTTLNTGNVVGPRTKTELKKI